MNSGSRDSLKVSYRCGFKANARQMRLTVAALKPHALAIERVLQCVASRGSDSRVLTTTRSTSSSPIVRGAPGRGSSSKPSQPAPRNRRRHLPTVARVVPSWSATSRSLFPLASLQNDPRPQSQRLRSLRVTGYCRYLRREFSQEVLLNSVQGPMDDRSL